MPTIANDYRALISGFSWNPTGVLGRPITITYSFETSARTSLSSAAQESFEPFSEADKAITLAALQQFDDASGLEFVLVAAGTGQIRFAKYNLALLNIRGSGAAGYPSAGPGAFTTVMINTAEGQLAFGVTTYLGVTPLLILHEIGHALGFKHSWEGDFTFDPDDKPSTLMIGRPDGTLSAIDRDFVTYLYGPDQSAALNQAGDKYGNLMQGGGFGDTLSGMVGSDTISGGAGANYLRGDDGNDSIVGGADFDDINGNQGNDTCVSGGGDDWVVGGKDNDSLVGSDGQNLVYGNLGDDTCSGGAGNDIVRGGQNNDVVDGGAGDDFVSGDRGDDTMTGGSGADVFHTFGEAGVDRVVDFHLSEGDRVQLPPGAQFSVSQVGADTVISMVGGAQMILVGVQASTLTGDWIFGA